MSRIRNFGRFWYDFIVGDDWTIAAGVVVAVAITAWLSHSGVNAWWFLPTAVLLGLTASVYRVRHDARSARSTEGRS